MHWEECFLIHAQTRENNPPQKSQIVLIFLRLLLHPRRKQVNNLFNIFVHWHTALVSSLTSASFRIIVLAVMCSAFFLHLLTPIYYGHS